MLVSLCIPSIMKHLGFRTHVCLRHLLRIKITVNLKSPYKFSQYLQNVFAHIIICHESWNFSWFSDFCSKFKFTAHLDNALPCLLSTCLSKNHTFNVMKYYWIMQEGIRKYNLFLDCRKSLKNPASILWPVETLI